MLNSEQNDEDCDATDVDSSNSAWHKKIKVMREITNKLNNLR